MANRKQFTGSMSVNADLLAILKETRDVVVTDELLQEQRVSFAFGNCPASEHITKESVRRSSASIRLAS